MKAYSANFEITKRSGRPYRSLIAPTGAAGRGMAYIEDPASAGHAKLSDGSLPLGGFVTRPILAGGPTLADAILPNRIELPFSDGTGTGDDIAGSNIISLEQAEEVQAESHDATSGYLYSGSGALTIAVGTPIGTRCSFTGGKFCIAQSTQVAEYYLAEILTPIAAGNVRARFTLIGGQKVV
jgi:hypothetical protein